MTNEEVHELKELLGNAVLASYKEPQLIIGSNDEPRRGNEQSIAFRIGIHLHELLKTTRYCELDLDCEYNRYKDDPKMRPNGSRMRPDLLIHRRGDDENNILAVEFAGWWKLPEEVQIDRDKLIELTDPMNAYQYRLGVLVKLEKEKPAYEYYRRGSAEQ